MEQKNFLNKLFSFKDRFNRMDYFVYGSIIPTILIGLGFFAMSFAIETTVEGLGLVGFLISLILGIYIGVAATVKRVRDRKDSIPIMIILMFIPYLNLVITIYLLAFKTKYEEEMIETKESAKIIEKILLGIYILAMISAVVIITTDLMV